MKALQFNPNKRLSAAELLQNEIFNDIRIYENEYEAEHKIYITNKDNIKNANMADKLL